MSLSVFLLFLIYSFQEVVERLHGANAVPDHMIYIFISPLLVLIDLFNRFDLIINKIK